MFRKIQSFRKVQQVYMPHALVLIRAEDEEHQRLGLPFPAAEAVKLWLPSELPAAVRVTGCATNLPMMELKMRAAQCEEALTGVRAQLHAKKHLINRRNKNDTGQARTTRSRTLISHVGDRVDLQVKKYKRARDALFALDGLEEHGRKFLELLPEHITLNTEEIQEDHESSRRMNRAGGGGPRSSKKVVAATDTSNPSGSSKKPATGASESKALTSWIWMAGDTLSREANRPLHACKYSIQYSAISGVWLILW